mgnify:CR=1 FL=1
MWDFDEEARRIREVIPGLPITELQFEDIINIGNSTSATGIDIDAGSGGIDILSTHRIDIDTTTAQEDINIDVNDICKSRYYVKFDF